MAHDRERVGGGSQAERTAAAGGIDDPFLRRSVLVALHLRRYLHFYVFTMIWALMLAAFPLLHGGDDDGDAGGEGAVATADAATGDTTDEAAGPAATDPSADALTAATPSGTAGATTGTGAARTSSGPARRATAPGAPVQVPKGAAIDASQANAAVQVGSGVTRSGVECKPGVPQIPNTSYAAPCQAKYEGANGGATYRGVSDTEIVIYRRNFPDTANSKAVDAVGQAAGAADDATAKMVRDTFIDYFNKSFELYGRKLVFKDYESENGSSTSEAQSKGKEGACVDADKIVKEFKAFMVYSSSQPFAECAAERQLMVNGAGAYFPESFYRKYHPYLWAGVTDCERINTYNAEYVGKRMAGKPAKWAKDALLTKKTRKFGIYTPDNDDYQRCATLFKSLMQSKYGAKSSDFSQYNYVLDISRFPDQAAQAIVQFAADGVTTVYLACDPISTIVLTQAAVKQNYGPEWYNLGVAGNDVDSLARLFHQGAVNGHFFGLSQLSSNAHLFGPTSQPGVVFKSITGKDIPEGTNGDFFTLVGLFDKFQAMGPVVTPANWARGVWSLPAMGAPDFPVGLVDYRNGYDGQPDHTAIDDAREVFWVCDGDGETCTGQSSDPYFNGDDGDNGTFKETMGGKRLNVGEWPSSEPPVYPPR
jgi:hypothetical protein